ncbi:MAG TPA: glycosyltransferase family 4 protein [Acidimicrobiales bacterium]|nr:glycosyltransferase family 4 protein [Acidimicrobiales bacterium]
MTPDPGSARAAARSARADGVLRVAFLAYRGNPRCGGQGVYTRHLSRALVGAGHHVTVLAGQPYPELDDGVEFTPLPSLDLYREPDPFRRPRLREIASAADAVELATMFVGGFGEPRAFSWRARAALEARRGAFDIVHDNQGLGTGLLRLLDDGWPVVASIHHPVTVDRDLELVEARGWTRAVSLRRWYGFAAMQSRVARRIPRILTVSQSSRRDIVRDIGVAPERIAVVPLGVDPACWRPMPSVARVPGRIMTTTSADVPLKGLVHLLEALAKLRTERDDAHLVVVGQPRAAGPVVAAIERFGLAAAVRFVSGEPDARLAERYAEASVAVVPSLYEGFSLPAIEAMACGVPLVATTGGALPEVVGPDGDAALSVPPGDAGVLAAAVGRILEEPALARRLGAAGRERVLARFSWDRVAQATLEEYRVVLGSRSC